MNQHQKLFDDIIANARKVNAEIMEIIKGLNRLADLLEVVEPDNLNDPERQTIETNGPNESGINTHND